MTKKYLKYNGITFNDDTPYPFYSFIPNEGTAEAQTDIAVLKDGALYSNFRYNERLVSLKGHITGNDEEELIKNKQLLYIKCNGKTKSTLFWYDGYKEYKAEAVASIPVLSEKKGLCYEFNINFIIPGFYWEEANETSVPLFQRKNDVCMEFMPPCIFTSRTTGTVYINNTDFPIYPKIEFLVEETSEYDLIITNETTGAIIELGDFQVTEGDIIVIDTENMTALHNGIDIINSFNDFSDFHLTPGENVLSITNGGIEVNSSVMMKFYKKFVGV